MAAANDYEYDVALSYAEEDLAYSTDLANALNRRNVKVFFDKHEKSTLWGKNLYTYLCDLYQNKAHYCLMLLSQHYASKLWPNHQREAAQARAFQENEEYILPVRLDETEIPGILQTASYLSWPPETAETIADAIVEKLSKKPQATGGQAGQQKPKGQSKVLVDCFEACALFDYVRGRDPARPWPLLPILNLIDPLGKNKSALIEYLHANRCCLPYGRAAVPYALLDFTLPDAPKTLLSILVTLRNQLQQHDDGQGRTLTFPRFDLGAAFALSVPTDGNLPLLSVSEVQHSINAGLPSLSLGEMGNALGNLIPIIPPLVVGLKWAAQIPSIRELLNRLEKGPGWKWYRSHGSDLGVHPNATVRDVLLRLYSLSMPGKPGREGRAYLVEHLLPAAFLADIADALSDSPRSWSKTTNVILFLDGFDTLFSGIGGSDTGIRLLEMLSLSEHRKWGEGDPLLLVLGSLKQLFERDDVWQDIPFERPFPMTDEQFAQKHAREMYGHWEKRLPNDKRSLQLKDLYLPLWLMNFEQDDRCKHLLGINNQG